jgi:probable FeS assembly SUF system protein SufT
MSSCGENVKITRDVKCVVVPFGEEVTLPQGTEVMLTQALGGTFTVIANGEMLRISKEDADALGLTPEVSENIFDPNTPLEEKILAQLKTCYDPEIPVNVVDLGLVYGIESKRLENGKYQVIIKMTLTAPGCGMGPIIASEAKEKILEIPDVESVEMEMVFDPPWSRDRMSETAKLALGIF